MQVATRRFRRRRRRVPGSTCGARCASRCAAAGLPSTSRARSGARRHPPLVILCDISGSMSRYSRMLLLFMHAITNDRDRVHSFLFGTRLTNVTRQLRNRDIDLALGADRHAGAGLGGRYADRRLPEGVQPGLVAPGAGPGGGGAADQRRARPRCRRGPGRRDGAAAQELPAADLAQPAVAVRRIRPHLDGGEGDDPPCRRFPPRPQPGQPARADRGAEPRGRRAGRGPERVGGGVADRRR